MQETPVNSHCSTLACVIQKGSKKNPSIVVTHDNGRNDKTNNPLTASYRILVQEAEEAEEEVEEKPEEGRIRKSMRRVGVI